MSDADPPGAPDWRRTSCPSRRTASLGSTWVSGVSSDDVEPETALPSEVMARGALGLPRAFDVRAVGRAHNARGIISCRKLPTAVRIS